MTTTTTNPRTHTATTIWRQIGTGAKMACGLREATATSDNELRMKALRGRHFVHVTLDPSDTYTVKLVRVKRNRAAGKPLVELVTVESASDVYCDMLDVVIYEMCNK